MREWFEQRPLREQALLLLMGAALFLWILYTLVWSPLDQRRDQLRQQNLAAVEALSRVDAMVSELQSLRENGAGAGPRERNLAALVNRGTQRLGLPVSRLQPGARGDLQVRLESAPFDSLVIWLHELEQREGLLIAELAVTPAGQPGRVDATLRVSEGL
ncbi:type II secretion system protein GspM [Haliea atlantica]|jgi:type II secretory pathway component PulM